MSCLKGSLRPPKIPANRLIRSSYVSRAIFVCASKKDDARQKTVFIDNYYVRFATILGDGRRARKAVRILKRPGK
ncbi:hypothetical protein Y032_0220g2504 [Ancylostoma ceylanicum]|uniref:Uncharacterized protein n=1 Tax=Ancylostoma ceylanicum TaxID=53326 RepID=A0A016SJB2_9BILA|nr:hypothetical protein Y032_0220g2504 [Ancylostoma ceylanicum]